MAAQPLAAAAPAGDSGDRAALAAVAAARGGDWAKAYSEAAQSGDKPASAVVRWLDFTRSNPVVRFADVAAFMDSHPDWPSQKILRRRAEAALAGESDDTAGQWFAQHAPVSGPGKLRAAQILLDRGKAEAGAAALRAAWVEGDFTAADEHGLLARFSALLRPEDQQRRLDRLLWDGDDEAARRMLPLVSGDYRSLAEARLAVAAGAAAAGNLVARVPAALRNDPGLALGEAQWWRKRNNFEAAAQLLLAHPDNPVRPELWWKERLLVARQLLAAGNPERAYQLVQRQAADAGETACDAAFLSGYIALRFRHEPALAFDDFIHIVHHAASPYAKSRAAYWAARAAAAAGKADLATKWYAAGADNVATFYGQLAAHELGKDAPPHPVPEPRPTDAERARFDAEPLVAAAELFLAAGDMHHAAIFMMADAEKATTPLEFAMLASLAETHGRIDLAIAVAKRAVAAGLPLMVHGYPVTALPSGGTAERALLLAIVRQESAFAPAAMSPVGARGLMQLMPATAKLVAGKLQLPFSLVRLSSDGLYNVTLGRSYIEKLLDEFGGSYPLAIAAYNAGPGRVREWLHDFGDPRGQDIGMVDWIEMIPFNETRAYVQRVLENLQIYRGQAGDTAAAFSLVADLAR